MASKKKEKKKKGKNQMDEMNMTEATEEMEAEEKTVAGDEACEEKDAEAVKKEDAEDGESKEAGEENAEGEAGEKDPKQERINELEDMVKRQLAEFDNFRKRSDKEKETMFEAGAKSVIEKLLPVVDNFERGLASIPEEEQGSAHAEGMMMIYKQLMGELEKLEVKPIEAVGKEFNPDLHNAVMQCESDEYESGIVAQELQKGYTYRDSVIRHSMVSVVS